MREHTPGPWTTAAAPELLEACERAAHYISLLPEMAPVGEQMRQAILLEVRAAIAKAEGKPIPPQDSPGDPPTTPRRRPPPV